MTHKGNLINKKMGFTLVEMAIVLAIVALLLGGLIPTISSQMEQQHRAETRKQLAEIQQALIGYAIINGRLPYPATATTPTNTSGAGVSNPLLTYGVIPWATLGINETDAWGRRFTYAVSNTFTASNFTLTSNGTFTVKNAVTGGTDIATAIPAVIISHGSNGCGAYLSTGNQITPAIAIGNGSGNGCDNAGLDQVENANNDNNFVSHDFTPSFDDLVVWISPNILFNRMVEADRLP